MIAESATTGAQGVPFQVSKPGYSTWADVCMLFAFAQASLVRFVVDLSKCSEFVV